jgi:hypothetical protein
MNIMNRKKEEEELDLKRIEKEKKIDGQLNSYSQNHTLM